MHNMHGIPGFWLRTSPFSTLLYTLGLSLKAHYKHAKGCAHLCHSVFCVIGASRFNRFAFDGELHETSPSTTTTGGVMSS